MNKWKKWNLSKLWFKHIQYSHCILAWIIKKMNLETASHFGTPNHRQITKLSPKWVPGDLQNEP